MVLLQTINILYYFCINILQSTSMSLFYPQASLLTSSVWFSLASSWKTVARFQTTTFRKVCNHWTFTFVTSAVFIGLMFVVSGRVHPPPGAASPRRHHRAVSQTAGPEIQLRQDDLPQVRAHASLLTSSDGLGSCVNDDVLSQVLRPSAPPCRQLPQEEVWPHQQPASQEEAEVDWSAAVFQELQERLCSNKML